MRLFFALWPPEDVRAQLSQWSCELQALCVGRPTQAHKLHLTLAFLGEVDSDGIARVERAAEEVAPRGMTLVLDRPGFWKDNRIAWAGASVPPAEMDRLVAELRSALSRYQIRFDVKPFAIHVTLLREAREPPALPELAPIRWPVDGFVLAGSARGRYEVIRSWGTRG